MKHVRTTGHRETFRILAQTRALQAAVMTLPPGESTGEPDNEHPDSEQWLLVLSGTGRARVGRRSAALKEGSLLVVEKRETHQVKNTGRRPVRIRTTKHSSKPIDGWAAGRSDQ